MATEQLEQLADYVAKPEDSMAKLSRVDFGAIFPSSPKLAKTLRCGTLRDGRFRVHGAFEVEFSTDCDVTVAEAPEFCEFGYGQDQHEALLDLQQALTNLFFALKESADKLGPDLQETRKKLEERFTLEH